MNKHPLLSIVTPTRGNFSAYWLDRLLAIQGNVEFVLVYPPDHLVKTIPDPRVKLVVSSHKGEMMQRFVGLLNAFGDYVLALDDDDYVHPDVLELTQSYFNRFPDSWILRLNKEVIDLKQEDYIKREWEPIPSASEMEICTAYKGGKFQGLLEIPIAPLSQPFHLSYLITPFKKKGLHFENFNNVIWKRELVRGSLPELSQATKVFGAVTWIPFSGFDRLLGLFVQAQYFNEGAIIGHWMPHPEQIRYVDKDPSLKPPRFHVISDFLLVKQFPQYGYLWSVFFSRLYKVPRTIVKALKWKYLNK
jgi:glycosyltransferase involved in cell wall biosynthesis